MLKKLNMDKFRILCAIFIIAIHTYPFVTVNQNLEIIFTHIICRVGVPFFLMVTGYFVLPKAISNKQKLVEYTKKILKMYILCILLYLPINIYSGNISNSILEIIKDIFINGTFYHLWYFPALILGIWIVYYLIKKLNKKTIVTILLVLYIIGLFGDSYYKLGNSINFVSSLYNVIFSIFDYTRNGLFYTPIFLYLGYDFNTRKLNIKNSLILFIISLILMIIEGLIVNYYHIQKHDSMYIMLIPVMIFLFSLILNTSTSNNKKLRNLSTIIYIIHPLIIVLVRLLSKVFSLEIMVTNSLVHFILVTILSIAFSIIYEKIKSKLLKLN